MGMLMLMCGKMAAAYAKRPRSAFTQRKPPPPRPLAAGRGPGAMFRTAGVGKATFG